MQENTALRPVRILHMGDIYLDSPFPASRAKDSEARRAQNRDTLSSVFDYIAEHDIDVVLMSGNLFDLDYATFDTVDRYRALFARCPRVRFFISPGQRDVCEEDTIYDICPMGENVTVFTSKDAEVRRIPEYGISVVGFAWTASDMSHRPLSSLPATEPADRVLICGHASARDGAVGVCVSDDELCRANALYCALSYGENFDGFHSAGEVCRYAYSGPLEAGSYSDEGFGGVNVITLSPEGATECERVVFGTRRYVMAEVDVSSMKSTEQLSERIAEIIRHEGYGTDTALCVVYTGHTAPGFIAPGIRDAAAYGVAELVTVDKSMPDRDEAEYTRDMSVRGELVRALGPSLSDGDEKSKEIAARAMRISFRALDNEDISNI